ncbi:response regulator [Rudaeicoccus suwonensis]|uniref:LuxR family two component transcriptional regulator n=1 Tax=Rudaeicoccus suwonensis TaxID=657409 RepID=A0A561E0V9_9MICO|nr:response regulator [Rudaeicoccus suwonensis]TWE09220.1 LuxR family two component transcriptional regulator [Rudaeicoccus suwonensis]
MVMQTFSASADTTLRVWAVDDHRVVLRGIVGTIHDAGANVVIERQASSLREFDFVAGAPDVLLLDIDLSDGSRAEDNVTMAVSHDVPVLLFTAETRPVQMRALIAAGAGGLVLKADPPELLIDALQCVAAGQLAPTSHLADALLNDPHLMATLTTREVDVLQALAAGVPKKAIGHAVPGKLSVHTVDTYFQRIAARYAALGRPVNNIYGSLREAIRDGYLDL